MTQIKRVHIKITSDSHTEETKQYLAKSAEKLNLTGYLEHRESEVEIVAEGEKTKIWKLVKKAISANKNLKTRLHEIVFYFKDPQDNFQTFRMA